MTTPDMRSLANLRTLGDRTGRHALKNWNGPWVGYLLRSLHAPVIVRDPFEVNPGYMPRHSKWFSSAFDHRAFEQLRKQGGGH